MAKSIHEVNPYFLITLLVGAFLLILGAVFFSTRSMEVAIIDFTNGTKSESPGSVEIGDFFDNVDRVQTGDGVVLPIEPGEEKCFIGDEEVEPGTVVSGVTCVGNPEQ